MHTALLRVAEAACMFATYLHFRSLGLTHKEACEDTAEAYCVGKTTVETRVCEAREMWTPEQVSHLSRVG